MRNPTGGDTQVPHLLPARGLKSVWFSPDAQNRKDIFSDVNTWHRARMTTHRVLLMGSLRH